MVLELPGDIEIECLLRESFTFNALLISFTAEKGFKFLRRILLFSVQCSVFALFFFQFGVPNPVAGVYVITFFCCKFLIPGILQGKYLVCFRGCENRLVGAGLCFR